MTHTARMRRSTDVAETEIRLRLAACYDLLLDLAEKYEDDTPDDGCQPELGIPSDGSATDRQESADARARSDTIWEVSDDKTHLSPRDGCAGAGSAPAQRKDP